MTELESDRKSGPDRGHALLDGNLRALISLKEEAPDPEVFARLAAAYNARAEYRLARGCAAEGLERSLLHGDLWWERIRAASMVPEEDLEDLVPKLVDVQSSQKDSAAAARNLGLLHYYLGEDDLCEKWCAKSLELDPKEARAHEVLAYLAYSRGDLAKAIEECALAVELDPRNHRAYQWLGDCYRMSDAREPAERYFLRALEEEEFDFLSLISLGELYLQEEETLPLAVQCFSRILSVNPRNWMVYLRFIEYYVSRGRYEEAAAECRRILALDPERRVRADAYQYLGLIHYLRGEDEEAEVALEAALAADPEFPAPHHYLGLIAERTGDIGHARELFERAIELDPNYSFSHVRLGYLSFDEGAYEDALRSFHKALQGDPEEYMAHLGISEVMRAKGEHQQQLGHILKAHEIAPTDGNVLNQLGIAHESLGNIEEAIGAYQEALGADPMNRHAANNLGFLLERKMAETGDEKQRDRLREEAVDAWRRRLLICRDEGVSIRGARRHLADLGVPEGDIEEWLKTGTIYEQADEDQIQ